MRRSGPARNASNARVVTECKERLPRDCRVRKDRATPQEIAKVDVTFIARSEFKELLEET